MTVFVNNDPFRFDKKVTLLEILKQQELHEQKGIAVAVNNMVISKANWTAQHLNDQDKITIIKATQGG
ncbi:MAG: sulfur carrier protein ThiS [Bacteroidia bacterium]